MSTELDIETHELAATAALEENPFDRLTPRELLIARRLAVGERNSEIAETLQISTKTVDTHRSNILHKLECRNNVDLARLAIRVGLVSAG